MKAYYFLLAVGLSIGPSGCATYRPLPLATAPDLAPGLVALHRDLPARDGTSPSHIDIDKPLDLDSIGLLAALNDPELRSERGQIEVAQAALLQSSLLPDPVVNLAYGALLGGPGTAPSYSASLSQDIAAIVTYHARVAAGNAQVAEVNAKELWREWQAIQKARLLALDVYWSDRAADYNRRDLAIVSDALGRVQAATAAGDLDLTALAPLLAAKASAEQALAALDLEQLKNWQALDSLLGLAPDVRFAIATPNLPPLPADTEALIDDLPRQRPDLVALQFGYRSADANLRAAILAQFPALTLGGSWNSDTSGIRSAGPTVTFDLPIFNRNQGQVAANEATRLLLREQYQARLDSAIGSIRSLFAEERKLATTLVDARKAAAAAETLSSAARAAYSRGNIDQRAWTDYELTTLQRQIEVVALERSLGETRITSAVELALGLPRARIAPPDPAHLP